MNLSLDDKLYLYVTFLCKFAPRKKESLTQTSIRGVTQEWGVEGTNSRRSSTRREDSRRRRQIRLMKLEKRRRKKKCVWGWGGGERGLSKKQKKQNPATREPAGPSHTHTWPLIHPKHTHRKRQVSRFTSSWTSLSVSLSLSHLAVTSPTLSLLSPHTHTDYCFLLFFWGGGQNNSDVLPSHFLFVFSHFFSANGLLLLLVIPHPQTPFPPSFSTPPPFSLSLSLFLQTPCPPSFLSLVIPPFSCPHQLLSLPSLSSSSFNPTSILHPPFYSPHHSPCVLLPFFQPSLPPQAFHLLLQLPHIHPHLFPSPFLQVNLTHTLPPLHLSSIPLTIRRFVYAPLFPLLLFFSV